MGVVQVTATVRNPVPPERSWEGLGTYELANGREETVEVAIAEVEFMGEIVGATVGFGAAGVEPILGLTAVESVGMEVDPASQRLQRRPAVRMKRVA